MTGSQEAAQPVAEHDEASSSDAGWSASGSAELEIPEMLDMLYELVAAGVSASAQVDVATVERFLHEHARTPKATEEFRRFFDAHRIEPACLTEPRLPHRMAEPAQVLEAVVQGSSADSGLRAIGSVATLPGETSAAPLVATLIQGSPMRWLGVALVAMFVLLTSVLVVGMFTFERMRSDLQQASLHAESAHDAMYGQREQLAALGEALRLQQQQIEHLTQRNDALEQGLQALLAAQQLPEPVAERSRRRARH